MVSFKNPHLRPTTDRVKESVFNKLMGEVEEQRILDLFGGTGNISIECLSRGAEHVDCVESHKSSLKIIDSNLRKLKIEEGISIHKSDVFSYLKTYRGEPYRVIIADPPFTKKIAHDVLKEIALSGAWDSDTTIVIEASAHERVDSNYDNLQQYDKRDFGDKAVFFFRGERS